jgi:hypothetical protein
MFDVIRFVRGFYEIDVRREDREPVLQVACGEAVTHADRMVHAVLAERFHLRYERGRRRPAVAQMADLRPIEFLRRERRIRAAFILRVDPDGVDEAIRPGGRFA